MTPYYDDGQCVIYNADCLEVLSGSTYRFDNVLTSPPYNLNGDGNSSSGTYFKNLGEGYDTHDDAMPHAQYVRWQRTVLATIWYHLAADGVIFYNHKPRVGGDCVRLPFDLVPDHMPIRQVVIWDRGSGFNRQFTYYVPAHEYVLVIAQPSWRSNTRSVDDVWRIPFETSTLHPAPFPLSLARRALGTTNGRSVLDPFMGSGTTLVAAKELGRKAVGIELSERYCEIAANRLAQGALDFGATA